MSSTRRTLLFAWIEKKEDDSRFSTSQILSWNVSGLLFLFHVLQPSETVLWRMILVPESAFLLKSEFFGGVLSWHFQCQVDKTLKSWLAYGQLVFRHKLVRAGS